MDIVVHSTGRHAGLVVGVVRGPWPRQPLGIHMESASIVQTAKGTKSHDGGRQQPSCTTGHLVPGEIQVYAASRSTVWQLRLPACVAAEDHCLCEGSSALGGKGPTASPW